METSAARARLRICLGIHRGVFQGFMVSDPAIYRRDGRARATATSSTHRCPATGTQGLEHRLEHRQDAGECLVRRGEAPW